MSIFFRDNDIFPKKWEMDNQKGDEVLLVDVEPGTTEHNDVSERFHETMLKQSFNITRLQRVQNKAMWRKFYDSRKALAEKYGVANPEWIQSTLFHGTRSNDPKLIYSSQVGFDIQKSANGSYGIGLYFALNSSYSHGYCYQTSQGSQMFLCSVILGNSAQEQREVNDDQDSIKGGGGIMFILKRNERAYPEYLITYSPNKNGNNNQNNSRYGQVTYPSGLSVNNNSVFTSGYNIGTTSTIPTNHYANTNFNNSSTQTKPPPITTATPLIGGNVKQNAAQEEEDLKKAIELSLASSNNIGGFINDEMDEDYQLALALQMSASESLTNEYY